MTRFKRLEEIKFKTLLGLCKVGPWKAHAIYIKKLFKTMKEMSE